MIRLRFTPTSASWLNLVERWFAEITRKRIRRGTFRSVGELSRAIRDYLRANNDDPRPFVCTASASSILRKIDHCQEALETGHYNTARRWQRPISTAKMWLPHGTRTSR